MLISFDIVVVVVAVDVADFVKLLLNLCSCCCRGDVCRGDDGAGSGGNEAVYNIGKTW